MKYYSTNRQVPMASLEEAVVKGLAGDKGLYMPERIPSLDQSFIQNMKHLSFQEIACTVAQAFFGEDIEKDTLRQIVCDTLSFDTPVVNVTENIYSLELFHGPTLAFKDVGARFMARLLGYFIRKEGAFLETDWIFQSCHRLHLKNQITKYLEAYLLQLKLERPEERCRQSLMQQMRGQLQSF